MAMGSWTPLHTSSLGAHGNLHSLPQFCSAFVGPSRVPAPCWLGGTSWVGMAPLMGVGGREVLPEEEMPRQGLRRGLRHGRWADHVQAGFQGFGTVPH